MAIKIVLVDSHPVFREGLGAAIAREPDMAVCGEAADAREAMRAVDKARPDVVVLGILLRTASGLNLIQRLKAHDAALRMLVCSYAPENLFAERAVRAGALGFVSKRAATTEIVAAVRRVAKGELVLAENISQRLLTQAIDGHAAVPRGMAALSNRELEVFRAIGQGLNASEIAKALCRSPHTVEAHRQNIKRKLKLKTVGDLYQAAVQWVLEKG